MKNIEAVNLYNVLQSIFNSDRILAPSFAFKALLNLNILKPIVEALQQAIKISDKDIEAYLKEDGKNNTNWDIKIVEKAKDFQKKVEDLMQTATPELNLSKINKSEFTELPANLIFHLTPILNLETDNA